MNRHPLTQCANRAYASRVAHHGRKWTLIGLPGLIPPQACRRTSASPTRRFFVRTQFMVGRARASSEGRFPMWPVVSTRSRPASPIDTRRQVSNTLGDCYV